MINDILKGGERVIRAVFLQHFLAVLVLRVVGFWGGDQLAGVAAAGGQPESEQRHGDAEKAARMPGGKHAGIIRPQICVKQC
jgi:hypothetical protein